MIDRDAWLDFASAEQLAEARRSSEALRNASPKGRQKLIAEYDEFRRKTTSDVIRRRLQPERLRLSEDRMQAAHVHSTAASVVRTGDSPGGVKTTRMKLMQTEQPKSPNHVPIDGGSLKRELARVAVQQRYEAESRAAAERTEQWETALRNQLAQERDRTEKLHAQLAGLREQHQRLQDEHRQSILSMRTLERKLLALKADLVAVRESVARLSP